MTDIETALREHLEHMRLQARAARADELEMQIALRDAGIPDTSPVRLWLQHSYDGPADPTDLRIAWADHTGDDSGLSMAERLRRELRRNRQETTNA
jgi:hypothetical protein